MLVRFVFILVSLLTASAAGAAPPPPELARALDGFRTGGPKGWAFVQSTASEERSLVERFDPLQPDHLKWTLESKNGRSPTPDETIQYRREQTRRTGGETAPDVLGQIVRDSCTLLERSADRSQWRFDLAPGGGDDMSAEHMHLTVTLHEPSNTIERVVLASREPFSPVLGVKVAEARTTIEYSLPDNERPSLLQRITVRVRGRAFFFKSLDSDMVVTYSDYRYAGKITHS